MKNSIYILLITATIQGMYQFDKDDIIPNASYMIGEVDTIGGYISLYKNVTFYTAAGSQLECNTGYSLLSTLKQRLDKNAPRPQPTTCIIQKQPVLKAGWRKKIIFQNYILFYDKHDNELSKYHFDTKSRSIIMAYQ